MFRRSADCNSRRFASTTRSICSAIRRSVKSSIWMRSPGSPGYQAGAPGHGSRRACWRHWRIGKDMPCSCERWRGCRKTFPSRLRDRRAIYQTENSQRTLWRPAGIGRGIGNRRKRRIHRICRRYRRCDSRARHPGPRQHPARAFRPRDRRGHGLWPRCYLQRRRWRC